MARKALVVDDSMLIRHTVCRFLEERGFEVDSATNGLDALEMARQSPPAFIVTDLLMPKMTGHELIAALETSPETASIPIIILAGKHSDPGLQPDKRVRFIIYKDIDIVGQLEKALLTVETPAKH